MDSLLEAINDYYHNHGHYPKVKVSREFYSENDIEIFRITPFGSQIFEIDKTVDQWELE